MKYQHDIGAKFHFTVCEDHYALVAVECPTQTDKSGNIYRVNCKGCFFARTKNTGNCSGHPVFEEICLQGGCKAAKCSPEYRDDNKYILYKRVVES